MFFLPSYETGFFKSFLQKNIKYERTYGCFESEKLLAKFSHIQKINHSIWLTDGIKFFNVSDINGLFVKETNINWLKSFSQHK